MTGFRIWNFIYKNMPILLPFSRPYSCGPMVPSAINYDALAAIMTINTNDFV